MAHRGAVGRRGRELMWGLPPLVLGLAALHQAWLYAVLRHLPPRWHGLAQLLVYGSTGMVAAWLGLRRLVEAAERRHQAESRLRQAYAELQEQQRRLTALHEFGKRAAGALDVQEVLTLAARMPPELVGARATAAIYFDPTTGRPNLEVAWNLSDAAAARLRRVVEGGALPEACSACQPLAANVNERCPLLVGLGSLAAREGLGALVCLPFAMGDSRVGMLASYWPAGEVVGADRLQVLDVLAAEVAAALEGARLRSRLAAAVHAGRDLARTPDDRHGLLARALDLLLDGWGAEAGWVLLLHGEPPAWELEAHRGPGELEGAAYALVLRLARAARERRRAVVVPRMRGRHGLRSAAAVPLEAEGQVLGAVVLASAHDGQFGLHQAGILEAVGAQLALAVRNAQLYHRLRETAVLEERYRLSREMHDTLAQTLGYLGLQADRALRLVQQGDAQQAAEELRLMAGVIREAYLDVREAIEDLRAGSREPEGLEEALRRMVEAFRQRSGIEPELRVRGPVPDVAPEVRLQLLRIVQEALANVRKHSHARRVRVELGADGGQLELSVADDGRGFQPHSAGAPGHHGLAAMRERAGAIGARLTIATGPGQGTRVLVRLPLGEGGPGPDGGRQAPAWPEGGERGDRHPGPGGG